MATILRAPNHLTAKEKKVTPTLYLAGPFDDDEVDGPSWRDQIIEACDDLAITIIDPRNERWASLEKGSPGRRGAYEWQCHHAYDADVVVVWIPEGSLAPTALLILGHLGAKRSNPKRSSSVIVGGDGWDGLVSVYAQNHRFFPLQDFADVVRIARIEAERAIEEKAPA